MIATVSESTGTQNQRERTSVFLARRHSLDQDCYLHGSIPVSTVVDFHFLEFFNRQESLMFYSFWD